MKKVLIYSTVDFREPAPSEEVSKQTPERALLTGRDILKLASFPESETPAYREKLNVIIDQALRTTINPHDRHAIAATGEIVDWRLFAQPGDQLPQSLIYTRDQNGSLVTKYDTSYGIGYDCAEFGLLHLKTNGLQEIYDELEDSIYPNKEAIKARFHSLLLNSNAFKFIEAFNVAPTVSRDAEQPLPPALRTIRRSQIIQNLQRLGMPTSDILRRVDGLLDIETTTATRQKVLSPTQRLGAYLTQLVAQDFNAQNPDKTFAGFDADTYSPLMVRTLEDPDNPEDQFDYTWSASRKLAREIGEESPLLLPISALWIEELMELVLKPGHPGKLKYYMEKAFEKAWEFDGGFEVGSMWLRKLDPSDYHHYSIMSQLQTYLIDSHGPIVSQDQLEEDTSRSHQHKKSKEVSLHRPTNLPVGRVHGEVLPRIKGADSVRIIQITAPHELPATTEESVLRLELFGESFDNNYPFIPGLKLIRKNEQFYEFAFDTAGDPYAPAEVPILPQQLAALIDEYHALGLGELASALEISGTMSVRQLVETIKSHSAYVEEDEIFLMDRSTYASEFKSFARSIRGGKLTVQCEGMAAFMQLSLQKIFGEEAAAITTGYALMRRNISSGQLHAQTVFYHNGRVYILDATPPSRTPGRVDDLLFPSSTRTSNVEWQPLSVEALQTPTPTRQPSSPTKKENTQHIQTQETHISDEEKVANIRTSLVTQLSALFDSTDQEAFFKQVIQHPIDGPLRKTVEIVLRANLNDITWQEIKDVSQLLAGPARSAHPESVIIILNRAIDALLRIYKDQEAR